jgi:2-methylcitrate dehydratase PrpD
LTNITEALGSFTAEAKYDDLPQDVVHEMERTILDSVGCAIAGISTERGKISAELARKLGGPAESTILGTSEKVASANAAFANGELINCLDLDAISRVGRHDVPTLIPPPLALAEIKGASGKDFLLATALAFEVSARIKSTSADAHTPGKEKGKMMRPEVEGFASATLGATVGAGKMLGFDTDKMANAIGIAGYFCPPNTFRKWLETTPVRMTKYGPPGWGSHSAVAAVLLSKMGYVGDTDLFEGDYGFLRFMGKEKGLWNTDKVLDGLGSRWYCQVSFKQYPCGL